MKKIYILTLIAITTIANAELIKLSKKEISTWNIKTKTLSFTDKVPLGNFLIEVTAPPTTMHAITLPFKAQIVSLEVARYQRVKRGELLANVTATEWIEAQKRAISDAIELKHHSHTYERKKPLCKVGIIPKKECIAALAELKTDRIKVDASKALLSSYGANKKIIDDLFSKFKIQKNIPVLAPQSGTITIMNASLGKSSDPSTALFVIQKSGDLWIESDLPIRKAILLKENESVILRVDGEEYKSHLLQIAPVINSKNQTRHARFLLKNSSKLLTGTRANATIILTKKALLVPKKAVVKIDGKYRVFVKENGGFDSLLVDILGEDREYYYIKTDKRIEKKPVVVTAVAVLKNMIGESDE